MSEHRGPVRRISPIQLVFAILGAIALAVGILIGQKEPGKSVTANACGPGGQPAGAACPSPTPTATTTAGGAQPSASAASGSAPGSKEGAPAPSTTSSRGGASTGSGSGSGAGSGSATMSSSRGQSTPRTTTAPSWRPRPPGGQGDESIVEVHVPPITMPTCILDCR